MKIKPVDDRILILPIEEEFNPGGLIKQAPNTQKKSVIGRIVEVGPDISPDTEIFNVGSEIVYGAYSGQEIMVDGFKHLLLDRTEVLAVVTGE